MEFVRYRLDQDDSLGGAHNRYIQPPQVGYFVTTVDKMGNINVTPVTMGTCVAHKYFNFTLSNLFIEDWDQDKYPFQDGIKQGYCNLREVPECVISYYGYPLLRKSWIVGMPIPKGINEIEVANLTPLPSQIVKPCGIAECPINLEAKVLHVHKLGKKWVNYTLEVVHVTVHKDLDDKNKNGPMAGYGMTIIDPIFEVIVGKGGTAQTDNVRLVYDRLDFSKTERCPEDIGCKEHWIGNFKQWINDEQERGRFTAAEATRVFELESQWAADRDPVKNGTVKAELTALLKKAVSKTL
jgi:flavin reductase (DIM6/NTAB) family NADH-FMN oxidoreductase RutF